MSSEQWQPNPQGLAELIQLLALTQSPDTATQQEVLKRLKAMRSFAEYDKYLVYIYAKLKDQPEVVRTVAGLILKNNLRNTITKMGADDKLMVKHAIFECLADPIVGIRRTAGTLITNIIEVSSMDEFPGILKYFVRVLSESNDPGIIDGVLSALEKICSDSADKIEADDKKAGYPLAELIPRLLVYFQSEHEAFRKFALACVNQFIVSMPRVLQENFAVYIGGLFHLTRDTSADVKVLVCHAFITLVEVRFEFIEQYLLQILQCVLLLNKDDDDSVALESCEFWPAIAESRSCPEILVQGLPDILPVLMEGMMFTDMEAAIIEEDEDTPKVEDMRPFIHQTRENAEDDPSDWNLRKCAAAAVDIFSVELGHKLLPALLPILQRALLEEVPWELRETAILALGAVAEGCGEELEQHLPQLIPYLFSQMNHPKLFVRSITCWSVCRYIAWIVEQPAVQDQPSLLAQLLHHLLQRLMDPSRRVQESAISALATLEEAAQTQLIPYLTPILATYMAVYSKYQGKNLLILYDAIGSLAEAVGSALNKPEYIEALLPPLIQTWNSLPDDDIRLFPLFECLTAVVASLGLGFGQFAPPVYQRCLKLIHITLAAEQSQTEGTPPLEMDFVVCSLDLIGGLVTGLGEHAPALVKDSELFNLLFVCLKHKTTPVRQSAFALMGELSKNSISVMAPFLGQYLPVLAENLNPEMNSACNNACWALGEIALRVGGEIEAMAELVVPRLIRMINAVYISRCLVENAAITLGRLGLAVPHKIAPHLAEFVVMWCRSLRAVQDDAEKDSAFRGMCLMIQANPHAVLPHFDSFADAITSWATPTPELKEIFTKLLQSLKNFVGPDKWNDICSPFPPALKIYFAEQYNV